MIVRQKNTNVQITDNLTCVLLWNEKVVRHQYAVECTLVDQQRAERTPIFNDWSEAYEKQKQRIENLAW